MDCTRRVGGAAKGYPQHARAHFDTVLHQTYFVSINDEFCIQNVKLCIKNTRSCVKTRNVVFKMMNFADAEAVH